MSDATLLERILVFSWVFLGLSGGFNGIYICFHGIRRLDPYFTTKPNVEWESHSPFDSFCRMHRYSFQYTFGLKRPDIGNVLAVWLYFTCVSLIVYWISMLIGFLGHQFGISILNWIATAQYLATSILTKARPILDILVLTGRSNGNANLLPWVGQFGRFLSKLRTLG